jgi:hypothetical protein
MYQLEGREAEATPQPQASEAYEMPKPQATDSIAPTEFPKLRSATGGTRLLHRLLHRHIRPSGGEDSSQVNAQARVLDRAIPEDLVKRLAKPAIHRPQMLPANRETNRTSVPLTSTLRRPEGDQHRPSKKESPSPRQTRALELTE